MTTPRTPDEIVHMLSVTEWLEIAEDICRDHGVRLADVLRKDKHKSIVAARFAIWYAMRNHPERQYSYWDIANVWGCDHSTVMHGVRMHKERTGGALPRTWHRRVDEIMSVAGGW